MYRVLVADDEPIMRDAMCVMISKVPNFQVVCSVESGEETIEYCRKNKVDLAFLDISMIGISGIEAGRLIHMAHPETAIFIVSVCRDFEFARKSLRSAAQAYLSKPVAFSTIRTLLEDYVKNHQGNTQQMDVLLQCLKQQDFRGMYYAVPEIVEQMCFDKDKRRLASSFFQMGQSLMDLVQRPNTGGRKCEDRFPINDLFAQDPKSWEIWLFDVMNNVFQQASINKCAILEDVFAFIDERMKENLSLAQITRACNISQGYLSRLFQQHLKLSVMEYLHIRKLALAKMYLIFTNMSTADVAFRLGYNESNYFSKVFKKYENITVHDYRKKHMTELLINK